MSKKRTRRTWELAQIKSILAEVTKLKRGKIGPYLKKKKLTSSHISQWKMKYGKLKAA